MTAKKGTDDVSDITTTETLATLESILASSMFINAPRMSRLLRFLIEKTISGSVRDTSEYAIGIEVFDRDHSIYSTNDDPIVRVQVGRLREKLKVYYASLGVGSDIEISIPLGNYTPLIRRMNEEGDDVKRCNQLAIYPFKCISHHSDGLYFTQGLNEELKHQLFIAFGKTVVLSSCFLSCYEDKKHKCLKHIPRNRTNHLLEGSIRVDAEIIRASIRLLDTSVSSITWSEQFDRSIFFAIKHQEELARSICAALKLFFATNNGLSE